MTYSNQSAPIGFFDSGIGGLTVTRQVMTLLPHENVVYFGDSARVPYGSKSAEAVVGYSLEAAGFLESHGVKMIVIACNTASAVALDAVRRYSSVPVVGVIEPAAQAAVAATRNGRIGVIGTEGTVRSGAYTEAIIRTNSEMTVTARPCPLFVGLAEEGLDTHPATTMFAREYITPLLSGGIDTLILGCTHYPFLVPSIAPVAGPHVTLIDPGVATALSVMNQLAAHDMLNTNSGTPRHEYYLSDFPLKFIEIGERFLGTTFHHVHRISLDELGNYSRGRVM